MLKTDKCQVDDCWSKSRSRRMCSKHYLRWVRHGDPSVVLRRSWPKGCLAEDCVKSSSSKGYCTTHYSRLRQHGSLSLPERPNGISRTSEYRAWVRMRDRCAKLNDPGYKSYGGRGIKVCEGWQSSANFLLDMGPKPSKEYSLDRIDNDGNYSCGKCGECLEKKWSFNCRWATRIEQARNTRRSNKKITYLGKTQSLSEWAVEVGIPLHVLKNRLKKGQLPEEALSLNVNWRRTTFVA